VALATPATPGPARPLRNAEARLASAVGGPAAMASAYVHAAAHLPDARSVWDRTRIGRTVARDLAAGGVADASAWAAAASAAIATLPAPGAPWPDDAAWARAMADAPALQQLLDVHEHGGTRWFRQEGFERWLDVVWAAGRRQRQGAGPARALSAWRSRWSARMRASGYRWPDLLADATAAGDSGSSGRRSRGEPSDAKARDRSRSTTRRRKGGTQAPGGAPAATAPRGRRKRA